MNRKSLILLLACVAIILIAGIGYWIYCNRYYGEENKILSTDSVSYAEEEVPHADPNIVGKWRNTKNQGWYKVYYDDYDEDTHKFWGKEWDESENVVEEHLTYHGNGWFRWEKKGKELLEYATMDYLDTHILNSYILILSNPDTLVYREKDYKHIVYHFSRVSPLNE